jgi:hypothetical protein
MWKNQMTIPKKKKSLRRKSNCLIFKVFYIHSCDHGQLVFFCFFTLFKYIIQILNNSNYLLKYFSLFVSKVLNSDHTTVITRSAKIWKFINKLFNVMYLKFIQLSIKEQNCIKIIILNVIFENLFLSTPVNTTWSFLPHPHPLNLELAMIFHLQQIENQIITLFITK